VAIEQALQTIWTKTARRIAHRFEQRWRQRRQGHAPARVICRGVHHAATEVLTTLNASTHREFSCLSQRLSFSDEKDNPVCANIDDFACKISPVFYQCTSLRLTAGIPT
jgi:hypothetical protein